MRHCLLCVGNSTDSHERRDGLRLMSLRTPGTGGTLEQVCSGVVTAANAMMPNPDISGKVRESRGPWTG